MKEFTVLRKMRVEQAFAVKARTAKEAEEIVRALPEFAGATEDSEVKDRRVTFVGGVDSLGDPTFFVRTQAWVDRL